MTGTGPAAKRKSAVGRRQAEAKGNEQKDFGTEIKATHFFVGGQQTVRAGHRKVDVADFFLPKNGCP